MIKQATDVKVTVGQNGVVWVSGEPKMENIAVQAIEKIESESHIAGLTDRIKSFLEKATGKKLDAKAEAPEADAKEDDSKEQADSQEQQKEE